MVILNVESVILFNPHKYFRILLSQCSKLINLLHHIESISYLLFPVTPRGKAKTE
jgi:hypothetical protein